MLSSKLSAPSTDPSKIRKDLDDVEYFYHRQHLCQTIQRELKHFPDVQRFLQKLASPKANPGDVLSISRGIEIATRLKSYLQSDFDLEDLKQEIEDTFIQNSAKDFVQPGFDATLDDYRSNT